ncbi:DUF4190 domain-containing protein [Streptomyces sp. WAC05374]|uniref:DUF4190 domain-containing protein n=1 Tax=unclassified Streptomyces TaxID=2593676 RepID=UPI000F87A3D5|nr:DUF4190 domain-containing protein [Streptomyces sp. WAC05374]RST16054.1 DUF4190 domain-containing protein [Streptomyces sp. WAC05374]TDF50714.1 DUF4190 domain-containing protein [Streptomyces sp. WAC05374]TDF57004.1 DUF4190 domain-containing protein [Streptomyces sp. WAC05374]TDF60966.1 DUF4190 domain-containing protein [Streptomyces sp. WAC05374]
MAGYGTSGTHGQAQSRTNGLAIAGLVCGIVGTLFLNVILGPLAIVFGVIALKQAPVKNGAGMAKAAIVLGIVDLVIFAILLAVAASTGGFTWYVGG